MAGNFPKAGQIYQEPLDRITNTLSRVSLDTFYQVTFSFGKYGTWFKGGTNSGGDAVIQGAARNQGLDFRRKMSLLCAEAELPGTSYAVSTAIGHYQGIVETFPNLRQFPPLNLTFYVDAEHVIIEVLERWMDYINPVRNGITKLNAYSNFNYPDSYKEVIHVTKYERSTFSKLPGSKPGLYHYEFINIWPTNLTSMKVNYGGSDVLKCSLQLSYDRYHTSFTQGTYQQNVVNRPEVSSADIVNRNPEYYGPAFNTDEEANRQAAILRGETVDGSYNTLPSLRP